jgi:hypothetical protein
VIAIIVDYFRIAPLPGAAYVGAVERLPVLEVGRLAVLREEFQSVTVVVDVEPVRQVHFE